MFENISRNLPGNANWAGSFYEQLSEYGIWDKDAFWLLNKDLVLAANKLKNLNSVDKEFASAIVRLQSNVDRLFAAHFNKNDVFKIVNLSTDDMYAFKERFDMAVTGVFSGEVLSEYAFELVNPLL
ncbi:hypothetical protein ACO0LM_17490 [Undibacterium sp. Di26W]|uniref:hypothetical protein n=1 Tax=Undibacterium sp. Di26W TaxID=3413035 RepID=UPI003BF2A5B1